MCCCLCESVSGLCLTARWCECLAVCVYLDGRGSHQQRGQREAGEGGPEKRLATVLLTLSNAESASLSRRGTVARKGGLGRWGVGEEGGTLRRRRSRRRKSRGIGGVAQLTRLARWWTGSRWGVLSLRGLRMEGSAKGQDGELCSGLGEGLGRPPATETGSRRNFMRNLGGGCIRLPVDRLMDFAIGAFPSIHLRILFYILERALLCIGECSSLYCSMPFSSSVSGSPSQYRNPTFGRGGRGTIPNPSPGTP